MKKNILVTLFCIFFFSVYSLFGAGAAYAQNCSGNGFTCSGTTTARICSDFSGSCNTSADCSGSATCQTSTYPTIIGRVCGPDGSGGCSAAACPAGFTQNGGSSCSVEGGGGGGGGGSCFSSYDCGGGEECCSEGSFCAPVGTCPNNPSCSVKNTYRESPVWIRVVSKETGGTTAWKGTQAINPVVTDSYSQFSVQGLDSNGYFQQYRPDANGTVYTFDKPTDVNDTYAKNRISGQMNLNVSGSGVSNYSFCNADTCCGTDNQEIRTITANAVQWTPPAWSNHFCGGGRIADLPTTGYPNNVEFCGDNAFSGDHFDYAQMLGKVDGSVPFDCDSDPIFQPAPDVDGCYWELSSNGYQPIYPGSGSPYLQPRGDNQYSMYDKLFPLLNRVQSEKRPDLDLAFHGYWTATYMVWTKFNSSPTQFKSTISLVPPEGYTCKDLRRYYFDIQSPSDLNNLNSFPISEDAGNPGNCIIELTHEDDEEAQYGNLVIIELEKAPIDVGGRVLVDNITSSGSYTGARGVTVELVTSSGTETTTTDVNGNYTFTDGVEYGEQYAIRVPQPSGFDGIGRTINWASPTQSSGTITNTYRHSPTGAGNTSIGSGGYEWQIAGNQDCNSTYNGTANRCWFKLTFDDTTVVITDPTDPSTAINNRVFCAPSYGLKKNDAIAISWTNPVGGHAFTHVNASTESNTNWSGAFESKNVTGTTSTNYHEGFGNVSSILPNRDRYFRFWNGYGHFYHGENFRVPECGKVNFSVLIDGQPFYDFDILGFRGQDANGSNPSITTMNANRQDADGTNFQPYYSAASKSSITYPLTLEVPYSQDPTSGRSVGAAVRLDPDVASALNSPVITASPNTGNAVNTSSALYNDYGYVWQYWNSDNAGGNLTRTVTVNFASNPPSCNASLSPDPVTLNIGQTAVITNNVSNAQRGSVTGSSFSSNNTAVATVSTASDSTSPYTTTVTGIAPGTATISSSASMQHSVTGATSVGCSDTVVVNVVAPQCTVNLSMVPQTLDSPDGGPREGSAITTSTINARVSGIDGGTVERVVFSQIGGTSKLNMPITTDTTPNGGTNDYSVTASSRPGAANAGNQQLRADVYFNGFNSAPYAPVCTVSTGGSVTWGIGPTPTAPPGVTPTPPPSCTAYCPLSCGQSNSCGTNCPVTDTTTPGTPVLNPINGNFVVGQANTPISWSVADTTFVTGYEYRVFAQGTATTDSTPGWTATNATTFNYPPTLAHGRDVTVQVRSINNTCSAYSVVTKSPIAQANFSLTGDVTGSVQINPDAQLVGFGPSCTNTSGSTTVSNFNGVSLRVERSGMSDYTQGLASTNFTIPGVSGGTSILPYYTASAWGAPGAYTTHLMINNDGRAQSEYLYCACPGNIDVSANNQDCPYVDHNAPNANVNFYLAEVDASTEDSWWQVLGGLAYSISNLSSPLNDSCDEDRNCIASVAGNKPDSTAQTSIGMAMTGATISVGDFTSNTDLGYRQLLPWTVTIPQQRAEGTNHATTLQENYEHFAKKVDLSTEAQALPSFQQNAPTGASPIEDGLELYYFSGSTLTIGPGNWNITGGRKVVIFADSDVVIDGNNPGDQLINVENGSFFAIISSGEIAVRSTVGYLHEDPSVSEFGINEQPTMASGATNANIEGVYIGDTIVIEGSNDRTNGPSDLKFIGAGTFFGVTDVVLERQYFYDADSNFTALLNHNSPSEVFIYRPDLLINFPEPLKEANVIWQEVGGPTSP